MDTCLNQSGTVPANEHLLFAVVTNRDVNGSRLFDEACGYGSVLFIQDRRHYVVKCSARSMAALLRQRPDWLAEVKRYAPEPLAVLTVAPWAAGPCHIDRELAKHCNNDNKTLELNAKAWAVTPFVGDTAKQLRWAFKFSEMTSMLLSISEIQFRITYDRVALSAVDVNPEWACFASRGTIPSCVVILTRAAGQLLVGKWYHDYDFTATALPAESTADTWYWELK